MGFGRERDPAHALRRLGFRCRRRSHSQECYPKEVIDDHKILKSSSILCQCKRESLSHRYSLKDIMIWSVIILFKSLCFSLCRIWLVLGLLYYFRAITMTITVLPRPDPNYLCQPKVMSMWRCWGFRGTRSHHFDDWWIINDELFVGPDHRGPDSDDSSAKSWNNRLWGRALHEWKVFTCLITVVVKINLSSNCQHS